MALKITFSMMCDALDKADGISIEAIKKARRNKLSALRQAGLFSSSEPEAGEPEYIKKDLFTFTTLIQAGLLLQFSELQISYAGIDKLNDCVRPNGIGFGTDNQKRYRSITPRLVNNRDILEQVVELVLKGEEWNLEIAVTRTKEQTLSYRSSYVRVGDASPFVPDLLSAYDKKRGDRFLEVRTIGVTRLIRDLDAAIGV